MTSPIICDPQHFAPNGALFPIHSQQITRLNISEQTVVRSNYGGDLTPILKDLRVKHEPTRPQSPQLQSSAFGLKTACISYRLGRAIYTCRSHRTSKPLLALLSPLHDTLLRIHLKKRRNSTNIYTSCAACSTNIYTHIL